MIHGFITKLVARSDLSRQCGDVSKTCVRTCVEGFRPHQLFHSARLIICLLHHLLLGSRNPIAIHLLR